MNAPGEIQHLALPPHSIEAERAVLGCVLMDNAAMDRIADLVGEASFYRLDHRIVWKTLTQLLTEAKPADVLTVFEVLRKRGQAEEIGGLAYLHNLVSDMPSAANIRTYAAIVHREAVMRELATAGSIIADQAYHARGGDAREILGAAEEMILKISRGNSAQPKGFMGMPGTLAEVMSHIDERAKNPQSLLGVATGFVDLDERLCGLQPGDLIVVAARPSMGKTAFAVNVAENVAVDSKLPVAIFSMEMSGAQLVTRLLSSVARVDSQRLRTGRLDQSDWERLGGAMGKLNAAPIVIDESPALSPLDLRARARRKWRELGGLGLIVVDYLQLMRSTGDRIENRATELGDITSSLKAMAKELHVPVVLLSQLNRGLEARANKRPVMSDLKDSGSIEQDADVILFIYRDEVYNENSPDRGIAEVIIGKQRNGPVGTVQLTFIAQHTRFENHSGAYVDYSPRAPYTPKRGPH